MIKTASWFTDLTADHVRIGISRGTPRFRIAPGYRLYRRLAPGPFLRAPDFTERYLNQLAQLDPAQVHADLMRIAAGRVAVLTCFERVGSGPCHRAMVAQWLSDGLDIAVPELGFEHLPMDRHPLLPQGALL